jgi:hypothetical protein
MPWLAVGPHAVLWIFLMVPVLPFHPFPLSSVPVLCVLEEMQTLCLHQSFQEC